MASHAESLEMRAENPSRVVDLSVSTFACIRAGDLYLLGKNRDDLLQPLGGGVKLVDLNRDYARDFLENDLGVKFKTDDGDLRMLVPRESLGTVLEHTQSWLDDSAIPAGYRELWEELIEYGVLEEILPREGVRLKLVRTICVPESVNRDGKAGDFQKLYVVHKALLLEPWKRVVMERCTPAYELFLASKKDIEAGYSRDERIARVSWTLLDNAEDLFRKSPLTSPGPASDPGRFYVEEYSLDDSS